MVHRSQPLRSTPMLRQSFQVGSTHNRTQHHRHRNHIVGDTEHPHDIRNHVEQQRQIRQPEQQVKPNAPKGASSHPMPNPSAAAKGPAPAAAESRVDRCQRVAAAAGWPRRSTTTTPSQPPHRGPPASRRRSSTPLPSRQLRWKRPAQPARPTGRAPVCRPSMLYQRGFAEAVRWAYSNSGNLPHDLTPVHHPAPHALLSAYECRQ